MLNDFQNDFFKMLIKTMPRSEANDQKSIAVNCFAYNNKIPLQDRINVHIDTIFSALLNTLKDIFPGVWQLLGEDCARGVALAYSHNKNYLPKHGSLEFFGNQFPEFLTHFPSTRSLVYIQDFANLEWLRYLSYRARNTNFIHAQNLPKIDLAKIDNIKIKFNESVFFISSEFPLSKIEDIAHDDNTENITLSTAHSYGMIFGNNDKTHTAWLEANHYKILHLISEGRTLEEAMSSINDNDQNTEQLMTDVFSLMLNNNLIAKYL